MGYSSLQDAFGIKSFKSPKVVRLGQKTRGYRGVYDTPETPYVQGIDAPAGGHEVPEIRKKVTFASEPEKEVIIVPPFMDLDRLDLGIVVFALGVMMMIINSK